MRAGFDHARQTGPALEKAYQFVLWLVPTVEKFPRSQNSYWATGSLASVSDPKLGVSYQDVGIALRVIAGPQLAAAR